MRNGVHAVWVSQHYLASPFQMLQQLPVQGRMAAQAGSMHVGTNIFLLPIHNPVYVAEQVATLDVLTGGRFIFGCGLGYRSERVRRLAVEMKSRVSRFLEVLEVARRLWTEEEVTHEGRHVRLNRAALALKPVQRPHPPVIARLGREVISRPGPPPR